MVHVTLLNQTKVVRKGGDQLTLTLKIATAQIVKN